MAAALEALIVVAIGLGIMAFFIWTMMSGAGATSPLHALGAIAVFLAIWGYSLMRSN